MTSVKLFTLPHAGGGTALFRRWRLIFPRGVDVEPVQLPGRERLVAEPPVIDPSRIALEMMDAASGHPYAIYGHSMGAWIAYEVIRKIADSGGPPPVRFYAAACRPPHRPGEALGKLSTLPNADLVEAMIALGGTSPSIRDCPELLQLLLPALRADLTWCSAYRCATTEGITVPITTMAGSEDPLCHPNEVARWEDCTTAECRHHVLPGAHFFLEEHSAMVVSLITEELLAAASQACRER